MSDEPRPVREGREKAEAVRYQYQLGDAPIRDLFGFIESRFSAVLVVRRPMPGGPEGAMLKADGQWIVVVNTHEQMLVRQRFTAAHELGHYLFDADTSTVRIDEKVLGGTIPVEMRANAFAVHLLLPAGALRTRFMGRTLSPDNEKSVVELAMEYGISVQSLGWHMKNVLDLSDADRKKVTDIRSPFQIAARIGLGYRVAQEMNARGATGWPRTYLALAAQALERHRLTVAEFEEIIGDPKQVEALLRAQSVKE